MSSYDNEIYRGPPEAGPTLEHDIRSYGSDVYIVNAPKTTLEQDVPPTEEPIRQESKPVQKKESKIAKAMKLLASCTAAVTIAATLSAPVASTPSVDADLPLWPGFSQVDINSNSFISAKSKNGHTSQLSVSGQSYRLEALQENLYMLWYDNDDWETAGVYFKNKQYEKWRVDLDFSLTPSPEALGTIQAENGDTLYFYFREGNYDGNHYGRSDADSLPEPLQNFIDNLSSYIRVTGARADGWGNVFIGDTILSDTEPDWNGVDSTDWHFQYIHYASEHGFDSADALREHIYVNDIEWSVYYAPNRYGDPHIWCVPSHEDLALGVSCNDFFNEQGISPEMQEENPYILNDLAGEFADIIINEGLIHYRRASTDTNWDNVTQPPADDPFDDSDYFHAAEFSLGQRSFRMDSMQDDVSIRHFYTGPEEIEEFDLWFAGDDTHVKLVLSTYPEGKDFYEYAYPGFDPIYYALYSWSDHPMSTSELDTLAYDIPNYINLTELTPAPETTAPPETTEPMPTEPDPYDYLPEYTQYIVDSAGMSYSPLARSNRVCHFSTNDGNYCLEAQTPDMFMLWENYYYDMKEESANSYITLQNIAESWSMGVWVFDEQVESVYDCFTLTTEDGTTLWFYIANFDDYTQQNRLEAVLSQLPDLVRLSHAKEGNWTKVLYGQSLIVDVTSSWSGLAYTASNDDFWYFDQMISVNDLQYYNLRFADSRTVNGTTWEFYTTGSSNGYGLTEGKEFYHTQVFAVPTGGDVCFTTTLYNGLTLDQNEFSNQTEYEAYIDANVHLAIDTIVRQGLSNFYSYQSPDNGPSDPTDPISPTFTEEYFTDLSFSFEGRSFRMDALRNDVSFRQIHQGEDHVQFDFRADDENLRVQLIIGSSPNGAEYYPYYLTNGTEIYVAAFNCWGEPWIADEQTLAALAQNLSAYVYIDESTEWFDLDKAAYDWIGEYSSYDSTPDGNLTHTCYAWSNRTCQFNVNSSMYRLESLTPEVFICWDDYSYDTESQSGASQIRIYHLTEAWNLGTWVSDDPEHLASADFSLTMEDGTQLWFYVWHYYAPADPLQDIIQRIENYVKLSPPREDGWNKVRIGQTMISDMNMQWNGLTSTVGTSWRIEAILSRETAAEDTPQFIETRTVNGITWNFYTASRDVFAVPQQEDIWLLIPLQNILDYTQRFRNQNEFTAYYNANISSAIDRIVNEGLIYYHLYP